MLILNNEKGIQQAVQENHDFNFSESRRRFQSFFMSNTKDFSDITFRQKKWSPAAVPDIHNKHFCAVQGTIYKFSD